MNTYENTTTGNVQYTVPYVADTGVTTIINGTWTTNNIEWTTAAETTGTWMTSVANGPAVVAPVSNMSATWTIDWNELVGDSELTEFLNLFDGLPDLRK